MNCTKLSVAPTLAATLIASPATAYADPVPTTDEVVGIMAELTDPNIPAASKSNVVTPGFSPEEAGTIDDHLNRMRHRSLPLNFVVTDIQPTAADLARASVATVGNAYQRCLNAQVLAIHRVGAAGRVARLVREVLPGGHPRRLFLRWPG